MPIPDEPALIDSIATRFIYLVHRGENASTDAIASALDDLQLSGTHGLILEVLHAHPGSSAAQVARYCRVTRQALLAPLAALESRGLISRTIVDPKVRVKPLSLTERGGQFAALVRDRVAALEAQVVAPFSEGERELLRELLVRYAESWERASTARNSFSVRSTD